MRTGTSSTITTQHNLRRRQLAFAAVMLVAPLALAANGCARGKVKGRVATVAGQDAAQLWVEPKDLESRDLFHGPGGRSQVPEPNATYRLIGYDSTGHSRGYDVQDGQGREWRVKTSEEAQSELVASRVLWAIGYHQPVIHYVKSWRLTGGKPEDKASPGRFRLDSDHKNVGNWDWSKDNPFHGTRPFKGLIVANLVLNNWDFGPDQNRIYEMKGETGESEGPKIRYVVQDVGAALGKTRWPLGTRNNIEDFESQNLIEGVDGDVVDFNYKSRHRVMVRDITVADVVWTCRLLERLSESQWRDAFRAADYSEETTDRYLKKIHSKIREGLSVRPQVQASR